jgi:hypothetical protein
VRELLPVALGVLVAASTTRLPPRLRRFAFPLACFLAGACASAVNGELAGEGWLFFISVDSLLVWAGASAAVSVFWWVRRRSALG